MDDKIRSVKKGVREGLPEKLEAVLIREKGSASGSRFFEGSRITGFGRGIRRHALNALREGL